MIKTEFEQKQSIIEDFMEARHIDALLLKRASSFAWATCGSSSYINTASSYGEAALLITSKGRYLITNNIEAKRLVNEELLDKQGWTPKVSMWHKTDSSISDLTKGLRVGADCDFQGSIDLSAEIARMRVNLLPIEQDRFRTLGKVCARAMENAIHAVRPGMSEFEISGLLALESEKLGAQAIVNLIATDERIFNYRHPLPTSKKMERYAMLVLCGRWKGLVASITRLVHFGWLTDELQKKMEVVAYIDATFLTGTRPKRTLKEVFMDAVAAYTRRGFTGEWELHHQGGPAGYEPREYIATPESEDVVFSGQTYAWNPSITGTKSEDTILVTDDGFEVLTEIDDWPMLMVELPDGKIVKRPAILEIK